MMEVTEFEPFITEDRHQRLHQSSFKSQKKKSLEKARAFAAGIPYRRALLLYITKNKKKPHI
jgi:hypothetical protein